MKKIILYISLIMFLLVPNVVLAYGIEDYYINAVVEKNGDLVVEEYFLMNGEYNGFERIINYRNPSAFPFNKDLEVYGGSELHNGNNLELIEIRAVDPDHNFTFNNVSGKKFSLTTRASKGDYGVYTVSSNSNGYSYLIYNPSKKNKAFYIKYRVKNIAINHIDYGELGWNFIGDSFKESIGHFVVTVHLPDNNEMLKVWAHGPLNGNVEIIDQETVKASIDYVSAYQAIDIRIVFDKEIISNSTKNSNVKALDKILKYEEDMAAQANYEREQTEKLIELQAEEAVARFEIEPIRSYYEDAIYAINRLSNRELETKLRNRVDVAAEEMHRTEREFAYSCVESLEKSKISFMDYEAYKNAREAVSLLTDETDVDNLMHRLDRIDTKIVNSERITGLLVCFVNIIFAVSYIIGAIFIKVFIYHKPKALFNETYLREIPSNLNPSVVDYLFKQKVSSNALSAHILKLVNEKALTYQQTGDGNDYILFKNLSLYPSLSDDDRNLVDLIMCGHDAISLKELKKYSKKSYMKFYNKYNSYTRGIKKTTDKLNYYDKTDNTSLKNSIVYIILGFVTMINPVMGIILLIMGIVSLIKSIGKIKVKHKWLLLLIYVLFAVFLFASLIMAIMLLVCFHFEMNFKFLGILSVIILFILYLVVLSVGRSKKIIYNTLGSTELNKWKAFKRFLQDFGSFEEKNLPEIELWNQYLVYAVLFGCADKLESVMKLKLNGEKVDLINVNMLDTYYISHIVSDSVNSATRTATRAYNAATSSSSSSGGSYSSGGGGGGGFSSGGGSFGGGGGGGRF